MAVPYFKRSVSKSEYLYHFKKNVQLPLLNFITNNFGMSKEKVRAYPYPILDIKKKELLKTLNIIQVNISLNKRTPENLKQYNKKLEHIDNAIDYCGVLKDQLQVCFEFFSFTKGNITRYNDIIQAIEDEKIYLKYWQKYITRCEDSFTK